MRTILLIDDSTFTRQRLKSMLDNDKYNIIEASDGESGIQKIQQDKPDCVILDLLMPNKTGIEVLEDLKTANSQTPIIIMTSDIQKLAKSQCLEFGVRSFLNKPPKKEELEEALHSVLGTNCS